MRKTHWIDRKFLRYVRSMCGLSDFRSSRSRGDVDCENCLKEMRRRKEIK